MESKKVSLKVLKALRDSINDGFNLGDVKLSNITSDSPKAYITVYGNDMEDSGLSVCVVSKLPFYSQLDDSNWTYQVVIGYPRKQGQ